MKTQTTVFLTKDDITALQKVSTILRTLDKEVLKKSSSGLYTWEDLCCLCDIAQDTNKETPLYALIWGNQSGNAEAFNESIRMENAV